MSDTPSASDTRAERTLTLEPNDSALLSSLCGRLDANLKLIGERLDLDIACRGNVFHLTGAMANLALGEKLLPQLYAECKSDVSMSQETIHLHLQSLGAGTVQPPSAEQPATVTLINTKRISVRPRGANQQRYITNIRNNDINFGVGPAGTGKTWLAVACAVEALISDEVQRILLVRPAVEAGEKLGFLPGDLAQKIDPYLRPLYDALHEMLGTDTVNKLIERNVIEIAPLAYMRGRTLNNSFIILDEAQNTTREQMKMFLTRIGFGSTAIVNGDATQIDLPRGTPSGLTQVLKVLENIEGISFTWFESKDVVRHPLVQKIVDAYEVFNDGGGFTERK